MYRRQLDASLRDSFRIGVVVAALALAPFASGEAVVIDRQPPDLDRWFYPFNQTPGTKAEAKVFAALTATGFDPLFDNRDGEMLLGFDTASSVQTGLGSCAYTITAARVTIQVLSDQTFAYDPTTDPWQSFLQPGDSAYVADPDSGRPVEMFGAAFRNGWSATTFLENGPFCAGCNCFVACKTVRNVYPVDYDPVHAQRDVSNNMDDMFDPVPFAVGQSAGLVQGQAVPQLSDFTFDLAVGDADVQAYLAEAMDTGVLMLTAASIFPAEQEVGGSFPEFFTKENPLVQVGVAEAGRLELTVIVHSVAGDGNGDGFVDVADLLEVLSDWGPCPTSSACPSDANCDTTVDVADLLLVLGNWT